MKLKALVLAAIGFAQPAWAGHFLLQYDAIQDPHWSDPGSAMSATLYLTTQDTPDATGNLVTAISGTIDGVTVDHFYPNPNAPGSATDYTFEYDDELLSGTGPLLNGYGLLVSAGGMEFNLFGAGQYDANNDGHLVNVYGLLATPVATPYPAPSAESLGFVTLSAAPEPASWAMMVSGFGLAGAAMRRRRTTVRFA